MPQEGVRLQLCGAHTYSVEVGLGICGHLLQSYHLTLQPGWEVGEGVAIPCSQGGAVSRAPDAGGGQLGGKGGGGGGLHMAEQDQR